MGEHVAQCMGLGVLRVLGAWFAEGCLCLVCASEGTTLPSANFVVAVVVV